MVLQGGETVTVFNIAGNKFPLITTVCYRIENGVHLIKSLLADHDMSVVDFSRLMGVHRSVGTRILKGERNVTLAYMKALCERFQGGPELFLP